MSILLGLDPGVQTGWAVYQDGKIVASGVEAFDMGDVGYGLMFSQFRNWLARLRRLHGHKTRGFAAVAYELPIAWGGARTTRIMYGFAAHIQERCAVWHCRPLPANIMTVKKFATGSGKATKADMIKTAARFHFGGPELGEHEADAIHVARWGAQQLQDGA